ncbi:excinuclease ABC subunit UvrC [Candidatus Bathycorpusculum sp.]|uniref:excinuclease ABC subunit UvrC n=1 Tax=Candidatus Bathycorpusculum sp. TaxID=2994959 RepID=UPI00281BD1BD|nr:excinuclease ABC subunit UvrC [Candidatus Termitimicrobium sp.]MCL2684942.1 excinuclease ABC subunit UvrC [Candidatus Termitimicrobium sp.]
MIKLSSPSDFKSSDIPTDPGVYLYRDEQETILYVGKAKNLRSRVKSYFSSIDQPPKTRQLLLHIRSIDWIVVNTEVEALLLENKLIKQHTPKYNIDLKDAKSYAYISLTRETYPRVLTSRKVHRKLESFGPYTDGFTRQDLQRTVVRVFKLRTCKNMHKRACLNYHINMCTAPCTGNIIPEQYDKQVKDARAFLNGNYQQTIEQLNTQMQEASQTQHFEEALELRKQIASIRLLTERQIVDNERRFDQDVMVFRRVGEKMMALQMGVRKGVLLGKKEFSVDLQPQIEQEFLKAFYTANQIPREILLNKPVWIEPDEKVALEEFLAKKRLAPVSLTIPHKADKLALIKLAEKNLESGLEFDSALVDLQNNLHLPVLPRVIECFDISNLGTEHVVSGMVAFKDAKPDKKNYRKFKIKTVTGQDDFASIHEVVLRRYKRQIEENNPLPDLIVIDGGPGQVSAAKAALQTLGLQTPMFGLAKEREEIYLPNDPVPRVFDKNSTMMLLLRKIRDATHDFSLGYNRKRRQMQIREEFKQPSKRSTKKVLKQDPQTDEN